MFCVTSIGDLKLLFAYDEINRTNDEYLYRLHLPQDVKVEVTLKTTEQEVVEVPFVSYVRHEKPELLGEISNLNWEQLVTEYGRLVTKHRNFYIETATWDMLEIIRQIILIFHHYLVILVIFHQPLLLVIIMKHYTPMQKRCIKNVSR